MNIVYSKPVSNTSFQDYGCTNINNHLIYFEKVINTYLKAKLTHKTNF